MIIINEILGNSRHTVQKVEVFGNAVTIISEEMTEEQKNKIVEKFNEKYEDSELTTENVTIAYIPFTRVKDVIKHFLVPGVISLALVLIYFLIRFNRIGWKGVVLKTLFAPVIAELLMFSIMAIVRIPFGRVAIALSIGLYLAVIMILTCYFENQKNRLDREED